MAADALPVICAVQSWNEELGLVKRLSMAVFAKRRSSSNRAVVMTSLTNNIFMAVEMSGDSASLYVTQQALYVTPVIESHRLVLVCQHVNGHLDRDVVSGEGKPDILPARPEVIQ
jgi:hypothetical protein